MAAIIRSMLVVSILACFASLSFGISGTATFYTTYLPSSCYGYQGQGTMIAAANPQTFNNKAACGRMYRVRCTGANCRGGSVIVKVVDLCPGCPANGFDLSREAFAAIANPDAGRISIDYVRV